MIYLFLLVDATSMTDHDSCFLAKNLQGWGKNCTFVTIKMVKTTNYTNYAFLLSGYSY